MATEAQVAANRLNAQKSTGPRTAEGKAVVAQNAVKHGLLAREGVLRGEDGEEFERHREALLEQLNPAGPLEVILAARIVDLTWRLQRAAQDRNETFGALYDRHTAGAPEPADPAERGATLGRMILEDYEHGAVLERLLRTERRVEGSLFRNLNELRRVHDQGRKADSEAASTLERWREEDDQARKALAFVPWRPADSNPTSDLGPLTPEFSCETNPIFSEPDMRQALSNTAVMSDSAPKGLQQTNPIRSAPRGTGMPPASPDHGRDAHATELTDPGGTDTPVGQSCETNPICPEPDVSQVQCGTTVMSDTAADGLRKTNPILTTQRGTGIPSASLSGQALPVNPDHGQDAHAPHGRDGRATHGQDGHATEPAGRIPMSGVQAQGQLCETNPIGTSVEESQVLCSTGVTADSGEEQGWENKANSPALRQGRSRRAGQPAVAEADSAKQSQFAERTVHGDRWLAKRDGFQ